MTTKTQTKTNLSFPCPECGCCDGDELRIPLSDVSVVECRECEATFTADDLQQHAAKFIAVAELLRRLSGE